MRTILFGALALCLGHAARAACPAPPEPPWCEAAEAGPDRMLGTPDDMPACVAGAASGSGTPCSVRAATQWRLQQDAPCTTCAHEWYVNLGCATSFDIVVKGADALAVTVTNVDTGTDVPLSALNECEARHATDPFHYCTACAEEGRIVAKDLPAPSLGKPAGSCSASLPFPHALPEVVCSRWSEAGTAVDWGPPLDLDGDGAGDVDGEGRVLATAGPPCNPCPVPTCLCGETHDNNHAFSFQEVRICVSASPGVHRIRTVGGGADWTIEAGGLTLHDSCAAAEASATPALPALSFSATGPAWTLVSGIDCPGQARVTLMACNVGNAPASTVPLTIRYPSGGLFNVDLAAHPWDPACQVPLLPGECRSCEYDVSGEHGVIDIDRSFTLDECHEASGGMPCGGLLRSADFDPCGTPTCVPRASIVAPREACVGTVPTLDASRSDLIGCPGAREIRFLDGGVVIPGCDWSASDTCAFTPPALGARNVTAEVRCSTLPACSGMASATVMVQDPPTFDAAIVATPASCGVSLEWTSATGYVTYDVYRSDVPPVPLDSAHRIASGLTETRWFDAPVVAPAAWRVEAVSSCGRVPNASGDVVAGPLPIEFISTIVAANEGDCAVRVTWDDAGPEAGVTYELYRSDVVPVVLDAAHLVQSGLTATSYLDAPPWGTPVRYRVVAVDECLREPNSGGDSAPVTPVDTTAPSFAGIVNTRDLGGCEVEVTWDAATDPCSGVAGYNVYRDHGVAHAGETLVASLVPGSPHVDTTPGNGTWVYVVRAVDAAGHEDGNVVFQQESEGSCTNDFPRDAGLDREDGIDSPNADGGHLRLRRGFHGGLWIRWKPSPDEGGLYPVTYSVLRGSLTALRVDGYTHQPVAPDACGLTAREYEMPGQADGQASYYLVAAVSGDNATTGYDSAGVRLADVPCR